MKDYLNLQYKKAAVQALLEEEYFASLSQTNKQFLVGVIFVVFWLAVGGAAGLMNTMFAAISQRKRDIGVLRKGISMRWFVSAKSRNAFYDDWESVLQWTEVWYDDWPQTPKDRKEARDDVIYSTGFQEIPEGDVDALNTAIAEFEERLAAALGYEASANHSASFNAGFCLSVQEADYPEDTNPFDDEEIGF